VNWLVVSIWWKSNLMKTCKAFIIIPNAKNKKRHKNYIWTTLDDFPVTAPKWHLPQWRRGLEFCQAGSSWVPLHADAANDLRVLTELDTLPGTGTAAAARHLASSPRKPVSVSLGLFRSNRNENNLYTTNTGTLWELYYRHTWKHVNNDKTPRIYKAILRNL